MSRLGWGPFAPLGEALRFLTILPMPGLPFGDERALVRSMPLFPLAGLIIGALALGIGAAAGWLWGPLLRALAVVAATTVLTAGLHLDGLADSCDALFSWRPRERKLEIMKDSRIGTMGALALILMLLLKTLALASLGDWWWAGALVAPIWGRWADVYGIVWFPSASEGGLGRTFHALIRRRDFGLATVAALVLVGWVLPPYGLATGLAVWPLCHWAARRMTSSLGGLTGDTYGALSELGEATALLALLALHTHLA